MYKRNCCKNYMIIFLIELSCNTVSSSKHTDYILCVIYVCKKKKKAYSLLYRNSHNLNFSNSKTYFTRELRSL